MLAQLQAWFVITRGSNLPTVWSNITVGWVMGFGFLCLQTSPQSPEALALNPWSIHLLLLWLGVSLSYVGGMILNDVRDRHWDALHRPERPIPAKLINPRTASFVAIVLLVLGLVITLFATPQEAKGGTLIVALLLVAGILIYNRWHKEFNGAPLVMGLCRVALPLLGFFSVAPSAVRLPIVFLAYLVTLLTLIFLITWVARFEAKNSSPSSWIEKMFFLIPLSLSLIFPFDRFLWLISGVYGLWILFSNGRNPLPQGVGARVADRLAALPIIDGLFLALIFRYFHPLIEMKAGYDSTFAQLEWGFFIPGFCFLGVLGLRRWIPST